MTLKFLLFSNGLFIIFGIVTYYIFKYGKFETTSSG